MRSDDELLRQFDGHPPQPVQEKGEEFEGDYEKRRDWFLFQRSYPSGEIPSNARRRAWDARPFEENAPLAQAWTAIGPAPTNSFFPSNWGLTSGRINAVAVSPSNAQLVLLGASTGGVWRSTNGGTTFAPVTDGQIDLAVGSIAFAPSNNSIVYAGLGDSKNFYLGSGVLKSVDGGQTWTRISNASLPEGMITRIEVDLTNPNRVFVAQYAQRVGSSFFSSGVWVSNDGGVSWTRTLAGLARDLALHRTSANIIYAALSRVDTGGSPPAGLYRSVDSGATWSLLYATPYAAGSTYDVKVATTPANPQTIYVYTGGALNNVFEIRVVVSNNGGTSFTNLGAPGVDTGQFGYNTYIYASPTSAGTIYVGTRDVFKSTNGGVSYVNLTKNFNASGGYTPQLSNTHPDQHALAFSPTDADTVYIGNDGGLFRSTNGGVNFSSLNASLSLSQFIGLDLHPTNGAITYGGTQDNGTQKRLASPATQWREYASGDGGNCVINPLDPTMIFTTYITGTVFRYINNGDTYNGQIASNATFGETANARIAFYPPFVGNGVNSTIYFGTWRLFLSTNNGGTWTAPAGTLDLTKGGSDVLSTIRVARSNTNVIYTGSSQGRVMVSTNGGANWSDITTGLPNRYIRDIAVSPTNPAVAYLTVSGFGTSHIFKTTNFGGLWTDIDGNLPDIPTNAVLIDPLTPTTIYVGTDIGVFRSTVDGTTWSSFNTGLPPVIVHAFDTQSNGRIQLATYGRGMYELITTCNYLVAPVGRTFTSAGGSDTVTVTTDAGCAWTAVSNAAWITINSGASGSGTGTVSYTVAANTGPQRTGTMTIAGESFVVTQDAFVCTYTLSPLSQSFGNGGGTGTINVTTQAGCAWTAASDMAWITITSGASGTGNGTVNFSVAANTGSTARSGNITVQGQAFVVAQAGTAPPSGLQYYPLAKPIRLFDTRATIPGFPACAYLNAPLLAGQESEYQARITCDGITIPANAQAIVGNATVTGPNAAGFVTLWPNGQTRPPVSNLNYLAGQTVANSFTIGLGSDGKFRAYSQATTHMIVDITGYYAPPQTGGLYYHPLAKPIRLFDTRAPIPGFSACAYLNAPLLANQESEQQARITCDGLTIPANAVAIVGNATAITPSGNGFITLWPNGQARPPVSNLNFATGQVVPNGFTAGLGSDGKFRLYSSVDSHFAVDVTGYYSPSATDANGAGLYYSPLNKPIRLFDTRAAIPGFPACEYLNSPLMPNLEREFLARITCDGVTIPATALAIVGNGTVVQPATGGFLTVWPNGQTRPPVSTLNFSALQVVPNGFTVGLGTDGKFRVFSTAGANFITDVMGYFAP